MPDRPRLAITLGDPHGIGPEVALKAAADPEVQTAAELALVGSAAAAKGWARLLGIAPPGEILDTGGAWTPEGIGKVTAEGGRQAMVAVARAAEGCLAGTFEGMVTAPLSKEAIHRAGFAFPGHTEFLQAQAGAPPVVMVLAAGPLRVALVTIHVPVAEVPRLVTRNAILDTLAVLDAGLRQDFGIERPAVAVLGLNPHAGDGGVLGRDEIETITPALEEAAARGLAVAGPFPADGFFGRRAFEQYDAVLAMYHDQGLAPFKALAMGGGVNVTLGLPFVRTSPDHGTAFDLAGENVASPDSMKAAIHLAAEMVRRRKGA